ncbi:MAG: hypothetical protein WA584_12620 [Pyrinomonadaceae bacterium]
MKKVEFLLVISFLFVLCGFASASETKIEKNEVFSNKAGTVNCWCRMKVGGPDWEGRDWDLGSIATYAGLAPQTKQANKDDCKEMCSKRVLAWYEQNKNEICKKFGAAGSTFLIGQSELANNGPDVIETLPVKCCEKPAVIKCPPNTQSQYDYDGTGRCKEQVGCKITPAPPNGTPIGNGWGFFWEGFLIKFVSPLVFTPKEILSCDNLPNTTTTGPVKITESVLKQTRANPNLTIQPLVMPTPKPER